jgi:predicted nuclease of predicted toxin-antitoxin system
MKFLANENFMAAGVRLLRSAGLDVTFVAEDAPSIKDREVMDIAIATNRTILTHDRDYGELVFKYGYRPLAGVIYFRMTDYLPEEPAQVLLNLLTDSTFVFEGLHTVIDTDLSIRQRRIPSAL